MYRKATVLALPLALLAAPALAADDGWRTERFNVVVRSQDIDQLLTQFGALIGVPVVVSDAVDATVSARFEDATGEQIIDAIAKEYALDWRYDGRRIEVSANSEQVSRILDMGGVVLADLEKALRALGTYEARYPLTAIDGQLGLLVGPPRYVAIVEIVLAELVEKRIANDVRDARLEAEEAERQAEERRLKALEDRRLAAEAAREPMRDTPLVNRGGKWGG